MKFPLKAALLGAITNAILLCGQTTVTLQQPYKEGPRAMKAENGLVISWLLGRVADREGNQVDVFDNRGLLIISLNVLRPMEEARLVGIYDVSARPGAVIAVAAVYASKRGDREVTPVPTLLLFDFSGRLLSAYALHPTHGISRLIVDEELNIWTLTNNFDDTDPPTVPMVVEYTPRGVVVRELLKRSVLWSHGGPPKESLANGPIAMGYGSGVVWFWLPGSTALVTISARDNNVAIVQTGLPKREKYREVPLDVAREPSGDVVEIFREEGEHGEVDLSYSAWSPWTRLWSRFNPGGCAGGRPIGADSTGVVYARRAPDNVEICSLRQR